LRTNSTISVPGLMAPMFDQVTSGNGFDFSLGAELGSGEKAKFRGGFKTWAWPFNHTAKGKIDNQEVRATETGHLRYNGIYMKVDRAWKYFFLTGGFDISFSARYKNDLVVRTPTGAIIGKENNRTTSVLTDKFNNQVNLALGLGPTIPLGKNLRLKGFIEAVLPFSPLYETSITVPTFVINQNGSTSQGTGKVNLDFFPVYRYGVGLSYVFFDDNVE
jgi:hypothetical protein